MFFFLLHSSFCQHWNISAMLHPILTKLNWVQGAAVKRHSLMTKPNWGQTSQRSHRDQKCNFHQKHYSYKENGMFFKVMHMHQLGALYESYWIKTIWGLLMLQGQKFIFTKITPPDGMAMKLMQMHQLELFYKSYCITIRLMQLPFCGVKYQSGVIWGHRGQMSFVTKHVINRLCNNIK